LGKKQSESDAKIQEELKNSGEIPNHIAIIMDGNGRWARKRGLPRVAGYRSEIPYTIHIFHRKLEKAQR